MPTWTKMKKVGRMLDMKMIDIVQKFNSAEFYEFETVEMAALIRSLFSDSDLRRTQLNLLKQTS